MERLTPEAKVSRGIQQTWRTWPFIAGFTARWKVIADESVGTACTNGPELRYAPSYVDRMSIKETFDLVTEEGAHLFLGHHVRAKGRNPRLWNIACDMAIFAGLVGQHMDLTSPIMQEACVPGQGAYARFPRGLAAEEYYRLLVKEQEAHQPQPQPDGDEDQEQAGTQAQEPQESAQDPNQGEEPGEGDADQDGQQGDPGGQGVGEPQSIEDQGSQGVAQGGAPYDDGFPQPRGEVQPYPGEATVEEATQEWQLQVAQAILTSQEAGTLPGWLREIAENLYGRSRENWRAILKRWATRWAPVRHTFDRPNRRHAWRTDIAMPARRSKEAGPGVVVTDVSGSMPRRAMDAVLGELEAILTTFVRCEVTLRMGDVRLIADGVRVFKRWDFPLRVPVEWLGRGGTDLGPVMRQAALEGHFEWMVVLSDMYWDVAGCQDPGVPVIWLTTRDPKSLAPGETPRFGVLAGPVEVKR
jgi:predicted metal-dependent peptidase